MTSQAVTNKVQLSKDIWNTLFALLQPNGLRMSCADSFLFVLSPIADSLVPCLFVLDMPEYHPTLWQRLFEFGGGQFNILAKFTELPDIMRYKFQDLEVVRPDITDDFDWEGSFAVSESRFTLELREPAERWQIEKVMTQFVTEVQERFGISFEYRIV